MVLIKQMSICNPWMRRLMILSQTNAICLHGNSFVADNKRIKDTIENNVIHTANLIESIANLKERLSIQKILITGSAGEYGKLST